MLFSRATHKAVPTRLRLRLIAAVQLVVMLLLILPALAHEPTENHLKEESTIAAQAGAVDRDFDTTGCPCCPDGEDSESDDCSSCGNCILFTSSPPAPTAHFVPTVSLLESFEPHARLLQVHIPIFVPPQNNS